MRGPECPHCHQLAMSGWNKMFLGPGIVVTCQACGRNVGVSWSAMWVIILLVAAAYFAAQVNSLLIAGALWVVGSALMLWLNYRYVPLIAKTMDE
jgi:hypothetical protein